MHCHVFVTVNISLGPTGFPLFRPIQPALAVNPTPPTSDPTPLPPKLKLLGLALVLLFLLLGWSVWWFFEWKIQRLANP